MPNRFVGTAAATAREVASRRVAFSAVAAAWAFGLCGAGSPVSAQQPTRAVGIYSCTINGKKITADRPIAECTNVSQIERNTDGSLRRTVQPVPTIIETEQEAQRLRADDERRTTLALAVRHDQNLMRRYPQEAAHQKARDKALDDARNAVRSSEARLAILKAERKPLLAEAEFYVPHNRELPPKLKQQLDANEASQKAQGELIQNANGEVGRINKIYDDELAKLKKLWAGAPPGSIGGTMATISTALPAASAPIRP